MGPKNNGYFGTNVRSKHLSYIEKLYLYYDSCRHLQFWDRYPNILFLILRGLVSFIQRVLYWRLHCIDI